MRIAILQRDATQRGQIERVLAQCGHACMPFSDGIALARALAASTIDMLVLDWQGTRLSGAELLKSVRAVNGSQIPVLFASEDDSDESVVRAFAVGADDYVSLPVCPTVLRARVNALLRRAFPDRYENAKLDAGPYHFDMRRQPETLVVPKLFNICSKFIQNSLGFRAPIALYETLMSTRRGRQVTSRITKRMDPRIGEDPFSMPNRFAPSNQRPLVLKAFGVLFLTR
jgi:DNA-binding response OmpR family regulator